MKQRLPKGIWKVAGFCRHCWKRFHLEIPRPIMDGKTMDEVKTLIISKLACCSAPDPRW